MYAFRALRESMGLGQRDFAELLRSRDFTSTTQVNPPGIKVTIAVAPYIACYLCLVPLS
jgi:hypothetical protein